MTLIKLLVCSWLFEESLLKWQFADVCIVNFHFLRAFRMIAAMSPEDSWVCKWQRISKFLGYEEPCTIPVNLVILQTVMELRFR
jgi:hypothetical protein